MERSLDLMSFEFAFANFNGENICNYAVQKYDKTIIKYSIVNAFGEHFHKNI